MGLSITNTTAASSAVPLHSSRGINDSDYQRLIEAVTDCSILMLDPAGLIQNWNPGTQALLEYEANEIVGQHFSAFYPSESRDRHSVDQALTMARQQGKHELAGWCVRKNGSRFWARVTLTALYDQQGRHRGFAKVTRELVDTPRETSSDENGRISAFIAMLAHELRNPLAPIANAVAVLDTLPNPGDSLLRVRNIIARQSKHMTRLVDDLLDMSRISDGKLLLESKPVLLGDVVSDALAMAEPFFREQMHRITIECGADPLWVMGDKARLIQVVFNLLHNAAKFTPAAGSIRVGLAAENDKAMITVADNGLGIDPRRLPALFNRFEQSENDSSKTFGGLGLGLSMAMELTRLQQGTVAAYSSGVSGEGSSFTVSLPRVAAPADESQGINAAKTILVVDDNRDSAEIVAMLLETMGYQCRTAYTGRDAIDTVKRERPRVVLLDIGLPDIDGHGVARQIIADIADPPALIAVTGYGQDRDRQRSFEAGFHAHVVKPIDPDKLQVMLNAIFTER